MIIEYVRMRHVTISVVALRGYGSMVRTWVGLTPIILKYTRLIWTYSLMVKLALYNNFQLLGG